MASIVVQQAVTSVLDWCVLNSKHLFLRVLEAGTSAELGSRESSPPGLQTAVFLPYPHVAQREGERDREHSGLLALL